MVPSNEKDKRVDEVDNPFENEDDSVILLKGLHGGGNGKTKKSIYIYIIIINEKKQVDDK